MNAPHDVTFLSVPGSPEIRDYVLASGRLANVSPPKLRSQLDDERELVILVVFAFALGAFFAFAVDHLWWLA